MNYCRFRNDFIKRMARTGGATPILPPEYQQVEYIESTGTQYINTGVYNTTPFDYYVKTSWTNDDNPLFGVYGSPNRKYVKVKSSGMLQAGYSNWYADSTNTYSGGIVYELNGSLKSGEQTVYVDGVLIIGGNNTATISAAKQIPLYAARNDNNTITDYFKGKIYRFNLTNNGTLILDFIPCYRKSDNKPGMYDLVTNTFFTNAGDGDFITGNPV